MVSSPVSFPPLPSLHFPSLLFPPLSFSPLSLLSPAEINQVDEDQEILRYAGLEARDWVRGGGSCCSLTRRGSGRLRGLGRREGRDRTLTQLEMKKVHTNNSSVCAGRPLWQCLLCRDILLVEEVDFRKSTHICRFNAVVPEDGL